MAETATVPDPLFDAILTGDADLARRITTEALANSVPPLQLVNNSMIPAMEEAGIRFAEGRYFVPDLLIRARAMKYCMAQVKPFLANCEIKSLGRVVIGTVKGDMHDIGKNLVCAMLEGCGFEIIDLGVNVAPEKFITGIHERQPQIVGLSALLTSTMFAMKTTIDAFKAAGVRNRVKVLVGGAPVTRQFADEIGADGTSNNAVGTVVLAKRVLGISVANNADTHLCMQ